MANFYNTAKKILKDYDYLHYKQIVDLAVSKWWLHTDWKTPELTMSSRLWSDIRNKWIKSTFIRIGDWYFSLRRALKEDNLLIYLKYRLKDFPLWQIDDKDSKYLLEIFWRDILVDDRVELLSLLESLKIKNKIENYSIIEWNILVNLLKLEDKKNDDLKLKIEILAKDSERINKLAEDLKNNSWLKELNEKSKKLVSELKEIVPTIIPSWLLETNDKSIESFNNLENALKWLFKNDVSDDFWEIFSNVSDNLELYDTAKLSKNKLIEFNKTKFQLNVIKDLFTKPEDFFDNITNLEYLDNKYEFKNSKWEYTHNFFWLSQVWDFTTIRWYANIKDIAKISEPIYFNDWWSQRNEDKDRCKKINEYLESASKRFLGEVVIWLKLLDNKAIKIVNWNNTLKEININFDKIEKWQISRIDWNHRLYNASKLKADITIPFCFVIFDQKWEKIEYKESHKNQEANIFYLLNWKNKPVTSEEALQVLLNMPDEEAKSLYQNDSTLWLTRICKQKYDKYCEVWQSFKNNFWLVPFTKFEKLIKQIEKKGIENNEILKLIELIFETIHHLWSQYEKIIGRNDFLILVLEVVINNKEKEADKRNKILKDFFDWIIKEWLEDISSTDNPILWELYKKQKSFVETSNVHSYEINEVLLWEELKNFLDLLYTSRIEIISSDITQKNNWLEKIVKAFINLCSILWNAKDNKTEWAIEYSSISWIDQDNFPKLYSYTKKHFIDTLWKDVANENFYIRHSEEESLKEWWKREKLEDKQFVEFLYSEYDNAIKFILDKAWFLIK